MAFENLPLTQTTSRGSHPRAKLRKRLVRLRAGIATQLQRGEALVFVRGRTVTKGQLLADLDAALAVYGATDSLSRQLEAQRLKERALYAQVYDAIATLELALRTLYGNKSPELLAFGLKPAKARRGLTPEEKVIAHARSLGTREIRRTLGPKQKQALKSGPVAVKITPKK